MSEENDSEPLEDVIESDQAVELRMLPENEEGSEREEIVTACAVAKIPVHERK
jgi:hypothetical protein